MNAADCGVYVAAQYDVELDSGTVVWLQSPLVTQATISSLELDEMTPTHNWAISLCTTRKAGRQCKIIGIKVL